MESGLPVEAKRLPLMTWCIPCFDKRRQNPWPPVSRYYWLDWSRATAEEVATISEILKCEESEKSNHSPVGLAESVITMSIGPRRSRDWVLKFRHLFVEIPDNDLAAFFSHPDRQPFGLHQVSPSTEYFEDEDGKAISIYEVIGHTRGEEFPIHYRRPKERAPTWTGVPQGSVILDRR